jgi:hypothetical protein
MDLFEQDPTRIASAKSPSSKTAGAKGVQSMRQNFVSDLKGAQRAHPFSLSLPARRICQKGITGRSERVH